MNVDTGEFAALTAEAEALRAQSGALLRAFSSRLVQASMTAYRDGLADALADREHVTDLPPGPPRLRVVRP
jgi:hypothetical protein